VVASEPTAGGAATSRIIVRQTSRVRRCLTMRGASRAVLPPAAGRATNACASGWVRRRVTAITCSTRRPRNAAIGRAEPPASQRAWKTAITAPSLVSVACTTRAGAPRANPTAMHVASEIVSEGAPPRRVSAHADRAAAERVVDQLLGRYLVAGFRLVERLRGGDDWSRWVLRRDRDGRWAVVGLREEDDDRASGGTATRSRA
jgi:hypothetical protein